MIALTPEQIAAELVRIIDRIAACFDESADRHTADRQLTLEEVERRLLALIDRIDESSPAL